MSEVQNKEQEMSEVVSLKIGESRFQVKPATFKNLKEEVFTVIEGDTYYVDRDGDIFKYILKYLRNKTISFPNDFNDGELLMKEAEFYGLSELMTHLQKGAGKQEIVSLMIMIPEENEYNYGYQGIDGIDILLSKTFPHVKWTTLVQGYEDRLDKFKICKCSNVIFEGSITNVTVANETTFGQETRSDSLKQNTQFAFHVKNHNVPTTLISGFLTSGFSLVTDMSKSNVKAFTKAYKSVRELVFQRIKPVK
ncbi:uncharacterized protein [Apostichopus japonicus]|uniref:uncharacterized protein isoform X1 n=1 Tax=Stichopus japonicus TaxID=307972 RepID=UPI003AB7A478